MDRNTQLVLGVVEHNSMQLSSVAVEHGGVRVHLRRRLRDDDLSSVPFVDLEAVIAEVDTQRAHAFRHDAVGPAFEDAAGIGAERYDIAEGFEFCAFSK